eukprot:g49888.t1
MMGLNLSKTLSAICRVVREKRARAQLPSGISSSASFFYLGTGRWEQKMYGEVTPLCTLRTMGLDICKTLSAMRRVGREKRARTQLPSGISTSASFFYLGTGRWEEKIYGEATPLGTLRTMSVVRCETLCAKCRVVGEKRARAQLPSGISASASFFYLGTGRWEEKMYGEATPLGTLRTASVVRCETLCAMCRVVGEKRARAQLPSGIFASASFF